MNTETLEQALQNRALVIESAHEARIIGIQAREDRRSLVEKMDQQVQLHVARASGATVSQITLEEQR